MKVLIVDDEEHVREGITLAIDWNKYGVHEVLVAEEGAQALELIQQHSPAVMFCDMNMPGTDGTELLQLLRRYSLSTQVIVVSGYDNFAYTHAALLAKGVDYLLKPLRKSDLEQALERAIQAWKEQANHVEKEIETDYKLQRADAILDEQKLAGYFKGEVAYRNEIRNIFYRRGLPTEHIHAVMILPRNRSELIYDRFHGDMELFVFSLNNIAHEILNHYGTHYFCRLDDYQWLLLTVPESTHTMNQHRYYVEKVMSSWQQTLGLKVMVGYYGQTTSVDNLPEAISGARAALLRCDMIHGKPGQYSPNESTPRLADQQLLLETAMKRKDKVLAAEVIRSFTELLRNHGSLTLNELQGYTYEANLILEKLSRQLQAEEKLAQKTMPLWIGDFSEWEQLLIVLCCALIDESGDEFNIRSLEAIHDYITQHYQEDITLPMLGAKFNFNPGYISRKFKEIYKTTIITYLTDLRMEKAQSLIVKTSMSVSEIANMLGYADENYFSKVFKKQTGLSPLQYRKEQKAP